MGQNIILDVFPEGTDWEYIAKKFIMKREFNELRASEMLNCDINPSS